MAKKKIAAKKKTSVAKNASPQPQKRMGIDGSFSLRPSVQSKPPKQG